MNKIPHHLCFDTLANELRIRILKELEKKPKSVLELSDNLDEEQSKISHSLKALRQCNFVDVEREGKKRIYSIKEGVNMGRFLHGKINGTGMIGLIEGHAESCENCKKLGKRS